jgi:integrase/recombinase XerD
MTDTPVSPLRRRMIEDMTIRKFAPKTQASYLRAVRNFTVFVGRSPDQASAEDLRRYQLHLASTGVSIPSQNAAVAALRFFFTVTLGGARSPTACPSCASRASCP